MAFPRSQAVPIYSSFHSSSSSSSSSSVLVLVLPSPLHSSSSVLFLLLPSPLHPSLLLCFHIPSFPFIYLSVLGHTEERKAKLDI